MTKKTDISSIKNLGAGILDTISGIEEQKSKAVNNEKIKSSLIQNEHANKSSSTISNNIVKEQRSKRSFMLTETSTQKLNLLKLCMNNKDLSSIVEEAITIYFEKNKESIESLIDIYNKVK